VVTVLPQATVYPEGAIDYGQAFNDSRFSLQCTDRTGIPLSYVIIWFWNGIPLFAGKGIIAVVMQT